MHRTRLGVPFFAVSLALAGTAPSQQTWIVDIGGGGQFAQIHEAVAAAAPGDTILVRAGNYEPFGVDRGVAVLADPGTAVNASGSRGTLVFVVDLPAGQRVLLRGLDVGLSLFGSDVVVRDCAGHVHFEKISTGSMRVQGSSQVSSVGSILGGVVVERSTMALSDCQLEPTGLVALECTDSHVVFAEGTAVGGSFFVTAQPAVRVHSGEVVIAGDSATTLRAGAGNIPSSAIDVLGGSLVLSNAATLVPSTGHPPISGPGQVTTRSVASLLATVDPGQLTSRLYAPGAVRAHTLLCLPPPTVAVSPQPLGQIWLSPVHLVLDTGSMPPGGVRTTSIALPPLPPGALIVLQSLVVQPTAFELSTPVVLTIDT